MKYPDLWDTNFGFYWYNDAEIFRNKPEDFAEEAEQLADAGINHVITFSSTHFRWSFRRYWDLIGETVAKIVEACHKHEIAVTEHHSCHLTFNPLNKADVEYTKRVLKKRNSRIESWPMLLEDCDADPIIDGVPLSSFRQIDGRTGKWARSNYHGWGMCFNNPVYRRNYFKYLETIYDTGVDGIMTDDVQYYGMDEHHRSHACACPYCRRKYSEETGYGLPAPGEGWNNWYGNFSDPSFAAFISFKHRSTRDFHVAVKEHYESLGLRPLRPNYRSSVFNRNPTAYCLDTLPDLDWIFQENCFSNIIRYSWPEWMIEAQHRFCVGRRRGIPSMSLFYPDRNDTVRFTWALAKSWGQMYLATPEGSTANEDEKPLRQFENTYGSYLKEPESIAKITFYESRDTRRLYEHAETRSLPQLKTWMQSLLLNRIPVDILQPEDKERFKQYDLIILNETAILSDEEIDALKQFVQEGGSLIWTGETGSIRGEDFTKRSPGYLEEIWGSDVPGIPEDGSLFLEHTAGKGKLILTPGDYGLEPYWRLINTDRFREKSNRVPVPNWGETEQKAQKEIAQFIINFLPKGSPLKIEDVPDDIYCSAYYKDAMAAIHLVNTKDTLKAPDGKTGGHVDLIPFPELGKGQKWHISLDLPKQLRSKKVKKVRFLVPQKEEIDIEDYSKEKGVLHITLSSGLLEWYGLVAVDF